MTHDLVHKTHMEIFDMYYPAVLSDWWMDDWISKVYGKTRTQKGPFKVSGGVRNTCTQHTAHNIRHTLVTHVTYSTHDMLMCRLYTTPTSTRRDTR
jgi:hypothetical protein